jgi:hypothetical protein
VNDELLTTAEVAVKCRHTVAWVLLKVKFKGMPCIRFNQRDFRFHWPSVLAWMQQL